MYRFDIQEIFLLNKKVSKHLQKRGGDRMAIEISSTKISIWRTCPFGFYLTYVEKVKVPKWIRFIFGSTVHRTIAGFYRLNPKQRIKRLQEGKTILFPQTKKAAIGLWIRNWQKATRNKEEIRFDPEKNPEKQIQDLLALGASMIAKYWQDNINSSPPIAVEQRFTLPCPGINGVTLVGSIDQIRQIGEEYWLLDIKTSWEDYGKQNARYQYPVHHDYQFTIYSLAFRMLYGLREAGIVRYPLGYKKTCPITEEKIDKLAIVTPRRIDDYMDLFLTISSLLENCRNGLFFKNFGDHCTVCDYQEVCAKWKITSIPIPVGELKWEKVNPEKIIALLEEKARELNFRQPRLF